MHIAKRFIPAVLAVGTSFLCAAQAFAVPALLPHRAVYDLELERQSNNAGISGLNGRLVIELMGSACEGYTVNFRLVSQFSDSDGRSTTSDLRSSTFEGGAGETFRFVTRNYVNETITEETDGIARRSDGDVLVALKKPSQKNFRIERKVLFPTEHLNRILAAAEQDETILQADVYDGSETGEKVYMTTAVIGRRTDEQGAKTDPALKGVRSWPVTISYFEDPTTGEQLPVYELSFRMYANGVSGDLVLDYGEFAVRGTLSTLDVLSAAPCDR